MERLQLELRGSDEEGGHECGQRGVSLVYGELDGSLGVKTTDRVKKKQLILQLKSTGQDVAGVVDDFDFTVWFVDLYANAFFVWEAGFIGCSAWN